MQRGERQITWARVWARRLERHHLDRPAPAASIVEVVRDVCGVHAQLLTAAELSMGIRTDGLTRDAVRAELWERRTLVKSATLRGTLHLHPADELPLWTAATAIGRRDWYERQLAGLGLTEEQLEEITAAIGETLRGRALTRRELAAAVVPSLGEWARPHLETSWNTAFGPAMERGLMGYGPNRGNEVTFVRADEWLGGWTPMAPDVALVEVARRFLHAYGPATPAEFAHWVYVDRGRAEGSFAALGEDAVRVDVEDEERWLLAEDLRDEWPAAPSGVRLLPDYDCYAVGCHPRDRLVPAGPRPRIFDHGSGPFASLLVDGVIVGRWRRRETARRVSIEVTPFRALTAAEREGVASEAQRMARFLAREAAISVTPEP
jgi:hypothetical protein